MAMFDVGSDDYQRNPWEGEGVNYSDPPARSPNPFEGSVRNWYKTYLGRDPENDQVVSDWAGHGAGAESQIKNSPEGLAYAARSAAAPPSGGGGGGGGSAAPSGSIYDQIRAYQGSHAASEGIGGISGALGLGRFMYGQTPSNNELVVGGQKYKVLGAEDNPNTAYWYTGGNDSPSGGMNPWGAPAGSPDSYRPPSYNATNIFDDPATRDFMSLLTSRVNALNQPYQPPSLGPLTDYLKSYFEKLQGPSYTPQQTDLLQTQSLDPLSRERDAVRQRITENASRRGLDPKSGIVQKQLSDAENQFEQIRTKTQAGFASKAVDLDRINAQQAASVGQLLANIEQSNFNSNEQRAGQALDISKMVPDLARQRMMDANQILSGSQINPTSLLQLQQQGDQFGSQQTQNYMLGIGQLLPYLLKAFGIGQ